MGMNAKLKCDKPGQLLFCIVDEPSSKKCPCCGHRDYAKRTLTVYEGKIRNIRLEFRHKELGIKKKTWKLVPYCTYAIELWHDRIEYITEDKVFVTREEAEAFREEELSKWTFYEKE